MKQAILLFLFFIGTNISAQNSDQWWAEAIAFGEKAAELKKARYNAYDKLTDRLYEQARKEWRAKKFPSEYEMYQELKRAASSEFEAIRAKYDPLINTALDKYVAHLKTRKLDDPPVTNASQSLRPSILYQEKAKYTEAARQNRVQGVVLVNVVFTADGRITGVRVVRGLPDGLNEEAVKAANELVFLPALKNGLPVSVRMSIEYSFNLI